MYTQPAVKDSVEQATTPKRQQTTKKEIMAAMVDSSGLHISGSIYLVG